MNTLKEQIRLAYPYRIELHAHTSPVSRCADFAPAEVVRRYHALGADGIVITNHAQPDARRMPQAEWVRYYCQDYHDACEEGKRLGMQVLLGMEVRFPQNNNDYLVYGVDEAFVAKAWEYLDTDLHTFYEACRADDRVVVQAHPFRNGMVLADTADLDGIEVFNMHPEHNSRVALAARHQAATGGIITGGTDFHHDGHEGGLLACTATLPQDSYDLARMLKKGAYVLSIGNSIILP